LGWGLRSGWRCRRHSAFVVHRLTGAPASGAAMGLALPKMAKTLRSKERSRVGSIVTGEAGGSKQILVGWGGVNVKWDPKRFGWASTSD
jgi:hypothetical protein